MPYITQTAVGIRQELGIFGNDYDTPDGTGVRDYIHVCDLASGHVAALKAINRNCGLAIYNLGTGHGYSVLDVVNAFMKVNGGERTIRHQAPQTGRYRHLLLQSCQGQGRTRLGGPVWH